MAANTTFDYFEQTVNISSPSGPIDVSIPDLNDFLLYGTQICINFGAQAGASIVLLIALLLLTKPEKRRSLIFIVNVVTLAINIVRTILHCLYFTGPFTNIYAYFSGDYSRVPPSAYAMSITTTVFELLVLLSVEVSLCLQTSVVCVTLRQLYQRLILALSMVVALVAVGFRMTLMVENCKYIISASPEKALTWLYNATNITTTVSICWFCVIFVTKLGFAVRQRRKLGMGHFGPMQIILIIGCHTLIIPALFSILQFIVHNPAMSSNVLTAVAIFLPLSSLWASASLDSRSGSNSNPNSRNAQYQRENMQGGGRNVSASGLPQTNAPTVTGKVTRSPTDRTTVSSGDLSPISLHPNGFNTSDRDLEAQGLVDIAFSGDEKVPGHTK